MRRTRPRALALVLFLVSTAPATAQQQARPDLKGAKDHALIPRYASSYIAGYAEKAFDEYHLPLGKFGAGQKQDRLEGKYTYVLYYYPRERSTLEVMRNYEQALAKARFTVLFRCDLDCIATYGVANTKTLGSVHEKTSRYLAAKLARPSGDLYAAVHVDVATVHLNILEVAPMEEKMITLDASTMADHISGSGHASIYGIYFDVDKAELKPESGAALTEIGKLLKNEPKLQLLVVGHTDNTGTFEHNMDLSRRRADAVVKALTAKYGVAATRLAAHGAGPIAPVATNRTDAGKAKNRRVELVEQ